ncbi:uracil-DNA glycosylase [Crenobacter sp. SG2303]|uniref:Uracil-DNA glycosylase n=1 Tax=Crenobacter oryzisoli TaxID=3056844 RepID=A0ABT7XNQ1_9NEIS|nr:uracil-DNA glycosylase [Crenobacter sp. SG2303]MDN0075422.1 uracil-DNA glycosylase [Crenobacter sp. SG2303]
MITDPVNRFIEALHCFPALPRVFNPWFSVDPEHDASSLAPTHRIDNLSRYLTERLGRAKVILIAEAPGYQGCHFSGIPMTSERILLGQLTHKGIYPGDVLSGEVTRCSRTDGPVGRRGAKEPTATVVWQAIKTAGLDPRECVLWNAFAFHPFDTDMLTNRKPSSDELRDGLPMLHQLLELFPDAQRVAIGKVSKGILDKLDIPTSAELRHPANGGITAFRTGFAEYVGRL